MLQKIAGTFSDIEETTAEIQYNRVLRYDSLTETFRRTNMKSQKLVSLPH